MQRSRGRSILVLVVLMIALAAGSVGCAGSAQTPDDPRRSDVDERVRRKWGKGLADLPTLKLLAISPHNKNITDEYEWAFSLYHAVTFGQTVDIEWYDVGGGGSAILTYLRNVYADGQDSSGIDVVWGGGEHMFEQIAGEGVLEPMDLSPEALAAIPEMFGGVTMRGPGRLWCGSAVSGFGFLYNRPVLAALGVAEPTSWDDLASDRMFGQVCLADPTQSGSAAAAYEMIVQSAPDWTTGWAKLLGVLSNAWRFEGSAGAAAKAPALGTAPVATCIDFYGANVAAEAPDMLVYVSPKGQTAFTPDPIGILKGAPNRRLAQRFVDFVLSAKGQALLALKIGERDGPVRTPLGRQPIRRDVYGLYAEGMSPWVVNPYEAGNEMTLDIDVRHIRYAVLKQLVQAAAVDNLADMKAARRVLIRTADPARLAEFNRLPDDVDTVADIADIARRLKDPTEAERIVFTWRRFFRDKYRGIAQ